MLRRKKRSCESDNETDSEVTDCLKKFRISIDPASIRFSHDIADPRFLNISNIHGITMSTLNQQPLIIEVHINSLFIQDHPFQDWPRKFVVKLPRYYPHGEPAIHFLESEWLEVYPWKLLSTQNGDQTRISHPLFLNDWNATKGFYEVISSLISTLHTVACTSHHQDSNQLLHNSVAPDISSSTMSDSQGDSQAVQANAGLFHVIEDNGLMMEEQSLSQESTPCNDGTMGMWGGY